MAETDWWHPWVMALGDTLERIHQYTVRHRQPGEAVGAELKVQLGGGIAAMLHHGRPQVDENLLHRFKPPGWW